MHSHADILSRKLHRTLDVHAGVAWRHTIQVTATVLITGTAVLLLVNGSFPPVLAAALASALLVVVAAVRALRRAARQASTILAEELRPVDRPSRRLS
ncbi:hypothetical protein [Amycolatopsis sp. cmx-8-4]|uniref:hypothetical protein n=1 Tax=Amycolatopsis sp. cmx-8-4 TaxID=2790947 RepID=UPI00397CA596